jgi:Raf kinase inhibitor-like YbhB/YbcL family protein
MHVRLKLVGPALLGLAALPGTLATIGQAAEPFMVTSPAYQDGDAWPSKFAGSDPSRTNPPCPGQNVSPPLAWSNAPAATKSFAILMYDPDGRNGLGSAHWVAYDIPPTKTSLAEGEASVAPKGFVGGRNNVGTGHYFGPCSSAAGSPHHYVITVIATDVEPGRLKPGLARDELLGELRGHALAAASIIGRYTRPSP